MLFNRHRRTLLAALLLVPAAAVPKARTPAKPAAPAPAGKFEIHLLVTAEPDKVVHPTKAADGSYPGAQPVTIAPRNQLLVGFVFFKDCKPDAAGNCNVDVDVQGVLPGGGLFQNSKASDLWRNKRAPHAGFVQLGVTNVRITIETKDPAGTYRLVAVAHDRNSGAESRSEASFQVR